MQPLVTIITPSFNQASYLEQTIRSVLEQDYPSLEYLVVDGGSTDGSVDIIRRHADRIAWWVSEKDSGQSEAVNKGLQRARGEYIGWLNSDDVYQPGAIASAVAAFQQHPDAGAVYGDALAIDAHGKAFNLMRARQYDLVDLLSFNIICQPAAFMRRSTLQQAGYLNQGYHLLMDLLLWFEMARQAPLVYVPRVWAAARYHGTAKNRTFGAAYGREAHVLIADLRLRPEYAGIIAANERCIMAGVNRFDAFYLTDAGQPGKALAAYWQALRLHPGTTLRDWKHILLALLSLLGLQKLRLLLDRNRRRQLGEKEKS
jgi:glycosyltransferase involved in cell wall biosynthesis